MNLEKIKKKICEIGSHLYVKGFVAANDGNISVKINNNMILSTPTGISKGFMTPDMILHLDMNGNILSGSGAPSSEIKMHYRVYKLRNDINAVLHAHPPFATAFAVAGIPFDKCVLPEIALTLGSVPLAPYATPSTNEVPDSIESFIKKCDAVLLSNHGVLTVGTTLEEAYMKMESVEHFAKIYYLAQNLGNINYLSKKDIEKLLKVREKLGIRGKYLPCKHVSE